MAVSHLDSVECFGERANLVNLDEDRVAAAHFDTLAQVVYVGNEEVVAHELNLVADSSGKFLPAFPVVLDHAVFD